PRTRRRAPIAAELPYASAPSSPPLASRMRKKPERSRSRDRVSTKRREHGSPPDPASGAIAIGNAVSPGPTIVPRTCASAPAGARPTTTAARIAHAASFFRVLISLLSNPMAWSSGPSAGRFQIARLEGELDVREIVAIGGGRRAERARAAHRAHDRRVVGSIARRLGHAQLRDRPVVEDPEPDLHDEVGLSARPRPRAPDARDHLVVIEEELEAAHLPGSPGARTDADPTARVGRVGAADPAAGLPAGRGP